MQKTDYTFFNKDLKNLIEYFISKKKEQNLQPEDLFFCQIYGDSKINIEKSKEPKEILNCIKFFQKNNDSCGLFKVVKFKETENYFWLKDDSDCILFALISKNSKFNKSNNCGNKLMVLSLIYGYYDQENTFEINSLDSFPRKYGFASILFYFSSNKIFDKSKKISKIELESRDDAIKFYEKIGFKAEIKDKKNKLFDLVFRFYKDKSYQKYFNKILEKKTLKKIEKNKSRSRSRSRSQKKY